MWKWFHTIGRSQGAAAFSARVLLNKIVHIQGSCAVLFCPFILLRTLKTQNVLLSPFKDRQLSFCLLIWLSNLKIDPKLVKLT